MTSRAVILGGGIAGLTIAFRRRSDGETTVVEASPRTGGAIRTAREDGFRIEGGPNTLRTNDAADRLIRDLGLEPALVVAKPTAPRWIVRGGRARSVVPGPPGLFTTVLSWPGKLRALGEFRVAARPASLDDESVDSFFHRRFGREVARYVAGPMVSGVYAGDPASLSVRSAFPKFWDAEARAGSVIRGMLSGRDASRPKPPRARTVNFTRGLAELPEALTAKLVGGGANVLLNAETVAIEGPLASGARWRVRTADGRLLEADRLVSTLEASTLARLLGERLPRSGARLAAIRYSPLAVAVLAFQAAPGTAPNGFGALIPRAEGFRALGILYPASLFTGRCPDGLALTTSFLGGALESELASAPDDQLLAIAEAETRRLHPALGPRSRAWIFRWQGAIPQLPLGHHTTLDLFSADLAELDGGTGSLVVTGPWRDGVSLAERIARGEEIGATL